MQNYCGTIWIRFVINDKFYVHICRKYTHNHITLKFFCKLAVDRNFSFFSVYARLWYFGHIINLWNAYRNLLPQPNTIKTWKPRIATNFVFIIETIVLHNFCQVLYFCVVFIVKHKYLPPNYFFFSTVHVLNVHVMMLKHESPTNINLQNGTIQFCCLVSHVSVNTLTVYLVAQLAWAN